LHVFFEPCFGCLPKWRPVFFCFWSAAAASAAVLHSSSLLFSLLFFGSDSSELQLKAILFRFSVPLTKAVAFSHVFITSIANEIQKSTTPLVQLFLLQTPRLTDQLKNMAGFQF
jgi:hypothetical protein